MRIVQVHFLEKEKTFVLLRYCYLLLLLLLLLLLAEIDLSV
jgi:hypothetical protein